MAAGLGFKDFTTGEVLTAADVDGYLMQGIWVFASAAARDAAVTSPQEGNACYLKDTNQVLTYSGSAWVAVGGGSPLTTKGDIYGFSTVDARIPIGANNTVLTADSTEALGLKWAAPAGGGKVLQVVSAVTTTKTVISSSSYTDVTNLTATITPTSATSKILVLVTANVLTAVQSSTFAASAAQIVRTSTAIMIQQSVQSIDGASATDVSNGNMMALTYLDSPATTSATTYKIQAKKRSGLQVTYNWDSGADTNASTITLMEIGA